MPARLTYRSPATDELRSLSREVASVLDRHRSGAADGWWTAAELRVHLDRSLDLLLAAATDVRTDAAQSGSLIAARDAVASHLRAAAEVEAAEARPEVVVRLLVRAAAVLVEPNSTGA